jgi:hypothetical protein
LQRLVFRVELGNKIPAAVLPQLVVHRRWCHVCHSSPTFSHTTPLSQEAAVPVLVRAVRAGRPRR